MTNASLKAAFPSQDHLDRFLTHLVQGVRSTSVTRHIVVLQGEHTLERHDTDRELAFHQEANFHYVTGSLVPSSTLIVDLPVNADKSIKATRKLFIPKEDAESSLWSIPPPSLETAAAECGFDLDEMGYTGTEDADYLKNLIRNADEKTLVHVFSTNPLDPQWPLPASWLSNLYAPENELHPFFTSEYLLTAMQRARLTKSPLEIEYIREANRITSGAHQVVMKELGRFAKRRAAAQDESGSLVKRTGKEGLTQWEIESEADAEAVFVATCKRSGCGQAYLPIVASGSRASTLHYVCNDRIFPNAAKISPHQPSGHFQKDGVAAGANGHTNGHSDKPQQGRGCCGSIQAEPFDDLHAGPFLPQVLLIDAGCEYRGGYASDVTRTMPVGNGGKFTEQGKIVYSLVLKMQKAAEAICKVGAHWDDLHLLTHRTLAEEFLRLGIFKNASVDELVAAGLTQAFYPHGLGHSLGLDVHDSRQLLKSEHLDIPQHSASFPHIFKYLRIRRRLEQDMVLTIEPGCYFSTQLMEEYGVTKSPHVDLDVLATFIPVGGVRLEDVVVVAQDGCENLTTVGKELDWIESVCSGSTDA